MNAKFTLFAFFLFCIAQGSAQPFVIHDVLVSSPSARISDTEFDPYHNRICWQTVDDHILWVCYLDTINWTLAVPDGKQILIDSSLTPLDQTSNAGEWGFDQTGSFIVYNKLIGRKKYISIASETGYSWSINTFLDAPFRINPHATKNPVDPVAAIQYISGICDETTKYKLLGNPGWELFVHNFKDAHWANDEQLLTGILMNGQVGLFDPANPSNPVQLTFNDGTEYSRPFMWRAPELGNSRMFFTVANTSEVQVFRETGKKSNHYRMYLTFPSPSSNSLLDRIASPEPVVYNGQSYMTFMASSTPFETDLVPAEIWIAKIDSLNPFFRMISDSVIRVRSDPEPYPTSNGLLTYYTEVIDSTGSETIYRIRKCETGIMNDPPTGISVNPVFSSSEIVLFPNPFKHHIAHKNATGKEQYTLLNPVGQAVWTGMHIEHEDFYNLPAGLYFLQINTPDSTRTVAVVKE